MTSRKRLRLEKLSSFRSVGQAGRSRQSPSSVMSSVSPTGFVRDRTFFKSCFGPRTWCFAEYASCEGCPTGNYGGLCQHVETRHPVLALETTLAATVRNTTSHLYGQNSNCAEWCCQKKKKSGNDLISRTLKADWESPMDAFASNAASASCDFTS